MLRNLLGHHTFGNTKIDFEQMQSNHMKPLFVPASSDSFQAIGKPPTVPGCLSDLMADKWQAVYQEVFPSKGRKDGPADLTMVDWLQPLAFALCLVVGLCGGLCGVR